MRALVVQQEQVGPAVVVAMPQVLVVWLAQVEVVAPAVWREPVAAPPPSKAGAAREVLVAPVVPVARVEPPVARAIQLELAARVASAGPVAQPVIRSLEAVSLAVKAARLAPVVRAALGRAVIAEALVVLAVPVAPRAVVALAQRVARVLLAVLVVLVERADQRTPALLARVAVAGMLARVALVATHW